MAGPSAVITTRSASKLLALNARPLLKVGVIGVFERGRLGTAPECASWGAFTDECGTFSSSAQAAPLAVKTLFEEAKGEGVGAASTVVVYPVRVVHSSSPANIATKTSTAASATLQTAALAETAASVTGSVVGPFSLSNGLTLIIDVDGAGNDTATFNATAASRTSTTGTYNLTTGQTLTFSINGGTVRTATFLTANFVDITAATPQEVVNVLNATIATYDMGGVASVSANAVKITSNRLGTGSAVNVTGGTANGALSFTTGSVSGTGDAVDASAVTADELKTLIEGDISGLTVSNVGGAVKITSDTTGTSSSVVVSASSTMETILGLDTATHTGTDAGAVDTLQVDAVSDGAWANSYSVKVAAPSNGVSGNFNLQVLKGSVVVESFVNLSMTDTDTNYVESVVNSGAGSQLASKLIRATDLDADVDSPDDIPATGTTVLTGGANGLTSLADADYVGGLTSGKTAGLSCFDRIADLDVIIAPDRATASFLNSLITYNNGRARPAFLVLEPPSSQTIAQIRTFVRTTAALIGSTDRAATYYPQTKVDNPDKTVFGNDATVVAPVSGQLAGLYARVSAAKDFGAFTSPAGTPLKLRTARALVNTDIEDPTNRGLVFDDRINPLMTDPVGGGIYVDGARTLSETGAFPFVGESRGATFVEIQIGNALDAIRHKNNTPALRSAVKTEVETFLRVGVTAKAFASEVERDAIEVDTSDALNPTSEQAAGRLNVKVGLATAKPAEFVYLNISQK